MVMRRTTPAPSDNGGGEFNKDKLWRDRKQPLPLPTSPCETRHQVQMAIAKTVVELHEAHRNGRPSAYSPGVDELVYRLAMLNMTNDRMAFVMCVDDNQLASWMEKHPSLREALERGRVVADAEVAVGLFHRAVGYSHPDTHVTNNKGEIILTEITKHYPPDVAACAVWLRSRQKELWPDTWKSNVIHTGPNGGPIPFALGIDLSDLTDDEVILAERVIMKLVSRTPAMLALPSRGDVNGARDNPEEPV